MKQSQSPLSTALNTLTPILRHRVNEFVMRHLCSLNAPVSSYYRALIEKMSGHTIRHNERRNTEKPKEAIVTTRLLTKTAKVVGWVVGWAAVGILFEFIGAKVLPMLG